MTQRTFKTLFEGSARVRTSNNRRGITRSFSRIELWTDFQITATGNFCAQALHISSLSGRSAPELIDQSVNKHLMRFM